VHIHFMVHLADRVVLTSQLYFPEDVTDEVHSDASYAYEANGARDTLNSTDGVAVQDPAESGLLLTISDEDTARGTGKLSRVVIGVQPT